LVKGNLSRKASASYDGLIRPKNNYHKIEGIQLWEKITNDQGPFSNGLKN